MKLRDLANTLGLSQTTVSRALNGYPEVAKKTRERVIAAARAAHYVPSGRAKSLATGRTMTIGHVIPVSTKHEMVNPVFGDFIAGAGEVYAAHGYDMLLNLVPDDHELHVYREMHARAQVDGIVVHGPRIGDRRIALLRKLALPFVVHGRVSGAPEGYSWVDVPNTRAFDEATAHLIELGHRRIGLINGPETLDFAQRRRLGYETALIRAGLTPCPHWMRSDDMTENYGHAAALEMLAMSPAPTAFVVASIISAIGARRAVHELGLTLGKDVSLVTFDDALSYLRNDAPANDPLKLPANAPMIRPESAIFTAMRSSVRAAGQRVAHVLLDQIADPDHTPRTEMMEVTLIPGRSTGPAPQDTSL